MVWSFSVLQKVNNFAKGSFCEGPRLTKDHVHICLSHSSSSSQMTFLSFLTGYWMPRLSAEKVEIYGASVTPTTQHKTLRGDLTAIPPLT